MGVRASQEWLNEQLRKGHRVVQDFAPIQNANVEPIASRPSVEAKEDTRLDTSGRVDLRFTSYRHRLADADAVAGKAAIDGLVLCGILKGDGPKEVGEVRHFQVNIASDQPEYTVIEIVKGEW